MSLQDEDDLPNDTLNHGPTGGRKWDRLAVNRDAGHPSTQVATNKLAMRHEGVPSFLTGEGSRDPIVATGGTQTLDMPGTKGQHMSSTHLE